MRRPLPALLFAVAVLSSCAGPRIVTTPVVLDGMQKSTLADGVLIGSQPSVAAFEELARQGYNVVVSTRGVSELEWNEREIVEAQGMSFVSIPMPAPVDVISDDEVAQLEEVLATGENKVVLHCASGNRAASLWAVWLVEQRGVQPEVALKLAEEAGMKSVRTRVEERLGLTPDE